MAERELTFGEKAVGLTFNPSNDPVVQDIKEKCAALIDECNNRKVAAANGDEARLWAVAITELQSAQMWAVKAATWNL